MTSITPRRLFAAIVAVALIVSAQPVWASHITARDTADACADAPEDGFTDTGANNSDQEEAVDCIAWYEITQGTTATTYEPLDAISRAQMASMVARMMRASETTFAEPDSSEDFFTDDDGSDHENNINFLAKHNVVQGTGEPGKYEPLEPVSRAQMATFLVNAMDEIGAATPAGSEDYFDDDDGSRHEPNINTLAELAIVQGRADDSYGPDVPVTRGNMAFFISRTLDYLVEQGFMVPPAVEEPPAQGLSVSLDSTTVEQGGQITGDITHTDKTISSAVLNGCGFFNEPVQDRNTSEAGIQFEETLSSNQQPGSCTLTFTVNYADGTSESESVPITITESSSPEAVNGTHTGVTVQTVNYDGNSFVGNHGDTHGDERFDYDSNDTYQFDGTTLTEDGMAQFEGMLTPEDVVDVTYNNNPDSASTFNMTTDFVPPATNAQASVGDFDDDPDDTARNDVIVTWAESAQPDAVYDVYRDEYQVSDNETFGSEDRSAPYNPVAEGVDGTSVTLANEPNDDDHRYYVIARSPTSGSEADEAAGTNIVAVPGTEPAPGVGPQSENAVIWASNGDGEADTGDVWRFAFDTPLAAPNEGDSIVVSHPSGLQSADKTITHGSNATFTLNTDAETINGVSYDKGQVLRVALQFIGGSYPYTVKTSTGVTDAEGDEADWANSFDKTIENSGTACSPPDCADSNGRPVSESITAADDGDGFVSGGDVITIEFDQTMNSSTTEPRIEALTVSTDTSTVTLRHNENAIFKYSSSSLTASNDVLKIELLVDTPISYASEPRVSSPVYIIDPSGWGWDVAASPDQVIDASA